jgi:hypothetical protein
MSYLWKRQYSHVCHRWHRKIDSILKKQHERNRAEDFCDNLWIHLYSGLLFIILHDHNLDYNLKHVIDIEVLFRYSSFQDVCDQLQRQVSNFDKQRFIIPRYRNDRNENYSEIDEIISEVVNGAIDKSLTIKSFLSNSGNPLEFTKVRKCQGVFPSEEAQDHLDLLLPITQLDQYYQNETSKNPKSAMNLRKDKSS